MEFLKALARNPVEPLLGLAFAVSWSTAEAGPVQISWIPFALIGIAIACSRGLPWISLGAVLALLIAQFSTHLFRFGPTSWPAYFGLVLVAIFIGASPRRHARRAALPFAFVVGLAVGILMTVPRFGPYQKFAITSGWADGDPRLWENIVGWSTAIALLAPAFWFVGWGIRAARERDSSETRRRAAEADLVGAELELRVSGERDRIAQDVHDIMAHSLSVIIAQADGARYLSDIRPETTNGSLAAIAQSARESLVEVRMLIDSLGPEPDGHSHPTLLELAALLERMQSAGLVVQHSVFGEPRELSAGQQMAVYRIVQESLTNALKHGSPNAEAQVVFDWRGPGLALTISSTGDGGGSPSPTVTRGLRGMHERARLAGGWLSAAADEEDARRFVVTAFIPGVDAVLGGFAAPNPATAQSPTPAATATDASL